MFKTATTKEQKERQYQIAKNQSLVERGKLILEVYDHKGGVFLAKYKPRQPGQEYYETSEFLSRINGQTLNHLIAERFIINETYAKKHHAENLEKLKDIRSNMTAPVQNLLDRYDQIRTDPNKLKYTARWGQKQLRLDPQINYKIYEANIYGNHKTAVGTYYDTMFFVHLLSYETNILMQNTESTNTDPPKPTVSSDGDTPLRQPYTPVEQKPDNFFRNFMILAALAAASSGKDPQADGKDPQADAERHQQILDTWDPSGNNQEILQEYPRESDANDHWHDNDRDTTQQSERDDDYYRPEDREDQQLDSMQQDYSQPDSYDPN